MENDQVGENMVIDKNYLMDFVLQLEYVADEDDKADIQRLWKKESDHVNNMNEMKMDQYESENDDDDYDNGDDENCLVKDSKQIKNVMKGFQSRGHTYFKHCNKEKIETISIWCKQLVNHGKEMEEI